MSFSKKSSFSFDHDKAIRIGLCGSGFISEGLFHLMANQKQYTLSCILTRRPLSEFVNDVRAPLMTQDISKLVDQSDVIIECSGDPIWGTQVVESAFDAHLPVITMNSELQIVAGSFLRERGILHESEGDQPGSIAALDRDIRLMGFQPHLYGSQKSYLNLKPDLESMQYWSKRNKQSLANTISFTDGTKVQIEAALTANGLNTEILQEGLIAPKGHNTKETALSLAEQAQSSNKKITDYILNPKGKGEVFIVASHDEQQSSSLNYYKFGNGSLYYIERPYHLGHLEALKSVNAITYKDFLAFNNSAEPKVSVAAYAKQDLSPGTYIKRAIGSMEFRGETVNIIDHPNHVPISLLAHCEIQRPIGEGEIIQFDDVALTDSIASKAWEFTLHSAIALSKEKEKRQGKRQNNRSFNSANA